ncbi:MAG: sensor histidine kinase, partial [Verrucomicrobiae bacterium]|nr:sensor histidine kinase [Verrucomicrobiae bacterium]
VRVTGICQVESTKGSEYRSNPESVSLRLRSESDIAILRSPSWWTPQRLGTVLVVTLVAMALATLWIVLLRRQVARQTVALRHRIEHEAALEERQRIAREFHDTLEQELAGLSLRLDAAVARGSGEKLQGLLEGSRGLVSRIQTETRNLVADLRDSGEVPGSLETALGELASRQPAGIGPEIRFHSQTPHPLSALPAHSVHHLKMIAGEAVANALKHAEARRIDLILEVDDDGLTMVIADDGRGFDIERQTHGQPGHFGCMGIRERCSKIGATVRWQSQPGHGTRVEIHLPSASERDSVRTTPA